MPIHCYSGRPGSGKSYSVVENVVLPTLRAGRSVVTNVPLNMGEIEKDFDPALVVPLSIDRNQQDQLNLDQEERLRGAVFIIDEAWRYWPSDSRPSSFPEHVRSFFTEHRHYVGKDGHTTEIVVICQSLQQLSPFVRELVDTTYITSKLDKVGRKGNYRVDIYSGPQTLSRPNYHDRVRQALGTYRKKVYRYYRSHTKNDTVFTSGTEEVVDKRNNVWNSPMLKFGIPIAICIAIYGANQLALFFKWKTPDDEATVPAHVSGTDQRSVPPVSFAVRNADYTPQNRRPISEDWRIAALATNSKGNGWVIIENTDGTQRTLPVRDFCSQVPKTTWEWECLIDGELVTYYSGTGKSGFTL